MAEESSISELLELVKTLTQQGRAVGVDQIASRMGMDPTDARRLVDLAIERGFAAEASDVIELTAAGQEFVKKHREEYLHQTHFHRGSLAGRLRGFFEGRVTDWRGHWRHHGFDDESVRGFYRSMQDYRGRIEETVPLTDLGRGDRCTVVLALGGHGMVRRLAEMGLTPGTEVTVVRSAPMHGPVEVSVRGVSLALGRGIARRVLVKPIANNRSPTAA